MFHKIEFPSRNSNKIMACNGLKDLPRQVWAQWAGALPVVAQVELELPASEVELDAAISSLHPHCTPLRTIPRAIHRHQPSLQRASGHRRRVQA